MEPSDKSQAEELRQAIAISKTLLKYGVTGNSDETIDVDARVESLLKTEAGMECLVALFGNVANPADDFYTNLMECREWMQCFDNANEATGRLWSAVFSNVAEDCREEFLSRILDVPGREFNAALFGMPVVVEQHRLAQTFLKTWLPNVFKRTEGGVDKPFWVAVDTICEQDAQFALSIIREFAFATSREHHEIAAHMLGRLRTQTISHKLRVLLEQISDELLQSFSRSARQCFYWSWITTAHQRIIDEQEFADLLQHCNEENDDADVVLGVLAKLPYGKSLPDALYTKIVDAVSSRIRLATSSTTRFHVSFLAQMILKANRDDTATHERVLRWVIQLQPVPPNEDSTWSQIDYLLSTFAGDQPKSIVKWFEQLIEASPIGVFRVIHQTSWLNESASKLRTPEGANFIARCCTSSKHAMRRIGVILFDRLKFETLPASAVGASGSDGVLLFYYEAQLVLLQPETIARLYVTLAPHVEEMPSEFRDEFREEVKLQAHNYAGRCRSELKRLGAGIGMIQEVVTELSDYFELWSKARKSSVNAIDVPEHRVGVRLHERMLTQARNEGFESSWVSKISKRMDVVYGQQHCQFIHGELQPPTSYTTSHDEYEVPVVDILAPEKMAVRRVNAQLKVKAISSRQQGGIS